MRQPFPAVVHDAGTLPKHDPRHRPTRHGRPVGHFRHLEVVHTARRVVFPDFCEPCLPSPVAKPSAATGWLHDIKQNVSGWCCAAMRRACGFSLATGTTGPGASH